MMMRLLLTVEKFSVRLGIVILVLSLKMKNVGRFDGTLYSESGQRRVPKSFPCSQGFGNKFSLRFCFESPDLAISSKSIKETQL